MEGSAGRRARLAPGNRRLWLVVIAIVAVVVITAGIGVALFNRTPSPTITANLANAALDHMRQASTVPIVVLATDGFPSAVHARVPVAGSTPAERAVDYVRQYRDLYGLSDADSGLTLRRSTSVAEGGADAVAMSQTYRGVPVYGAGIVIPLEGSESLGSIGKLRPALGVDVVPAITAEAAQRAAGQANGTTSLVVFDPSLFGVTAQEPNDLAPRLAWRVVLGSPVHEEVFVDAHSGDVFLRLPTRPDVYSIKVRTLDEIGLMTDFGCLFKGRSPDGGDADASAAADLFHDTYQWYLASFGRDSYNGLSAPVEAAVHGRFVNADGTEFLNAHWAPACAAFEFSSGMVTDDVVTHEFTHAVTQFRSGLVYFGYPGALNESFSDVMAFLHTGDPLIGNGSAKGTLRDLSNPGATDADDFDLGTMDSDFQYGDNGGVHSNSGIPNGIAYQIARDPNTGLGDERAAQLYFAALALHTPTADFSEHRFALETAGVMLGFSKGEICEIGRKFTNAGIGWNDLSCEHETAWHDVDQDGVPDWKDNCDNAANPLQENLDKDFEGDACDADDDDDGVPESVQAGAGDNCPTVPNPDQKDFNSNGVGAACDASEDGDVDNDGVGDKIDNCPHDYNPRPQPDMDGDGEGDACDPDLDADGIGTNDDNCPDVANANQADGDGDGVGDVCDPCPTAADSGVSWSTITYFTKDGQLVTDFRPVFADSDGDGLPDSCDRQASGIRGGVITAADGGPVAIKPDAGGDLVVSGDPGSEIAIVLAMCELICPEQPPADPCVDVRVEASTTDVVPYVRDGSGNTVSRVGSDDAVRIKPDGGTSYELVLALAGAVNEAPVQVTIGRCSGGSPGPIPTPGATPTSTTVPPVTAPAGGQISLEQAGSTRTFAASCAIGEYPADMGGGYAFSIQGTAPRAGGGVDYLALVVDLTDLASIDGTHSDDAIGTTSFGDGAGYNMSGLTVTVRDNGTAGSYSAKAGFGGEAIGGTFACPGLTLPN